MLTVCVHVCLRVQVCVCRCRHTCAVRLCVNWKSAPRCSLARLLPAYQFSEYHLIIVPIRRPPFPGWLLFSLFRSRVPSRRHASNTANTLFFSKRCYGYVAASKWEGLNKGGRGLAVKRSKNHGSWYVRCFAAQSVVSDSWNQDCLSSFMLHYARAFSLYPLVLQLHAAATAASSRALRSGVPSTARRTWPTRSGALGRRCFTRTQILCRHWMLNTGMR